jgi:hypothetical protein
LWETRKEEMIQKIKQNKLGKNLKPIIQMDKNNNVMQEWDSLKSASQFLNIKSGDISSVCNGRQKSAGGYIWKYK